MYSLRKLFWRIGGNIISKGENDFVHLPNEPTHRHRKKNYVWNFLRRLYVTKPVVRSRCPYTKVLFRLFLVWPSSGRRLSGSSLLSVKLSSLDRVLECKVSKHDTNVTIFRRFFRSTLERTWRILITIYPSFLKVSAYVHSKKKDCWNILDPHPLFNS